MNIKKLVPLTVRSFDFNIVAQRPRLLEKLRTLTIHPYSGMNDELDTLLPEVSVRKVKCKLLLAYKLGKLVGWATLSKEPSSFPFAGASDSFHPRMGHLFQVYIDPSYRKQGIATALLNKAQRWAGKETIRVCPHDLPSRSFFGKFDSNVKRL